MGNCFRGSSTEDFTRLNETEATPARSVVSVAEPPPPYPTQQHPQRRTRSHRPSHNTTYHPTPGIQRTAHQLTEDEQIKIAQRIGLIQHLPTGLYFQHSEKKSQECAICMIDFEVGVQMRYLPCLHIYHKDCIDDWLMRSFTCPSCMEPVDAALLASFDA